MSDIVGSCSRGSSGPRPKTSSRISSITRSFSTRLDVDGDGPEPAGLKRHSPGAHGGLRKASPRLLAVPGKELVQAQVVNPFGDRGGNAVQHECLEFLPLVRLRNYNQISHLGPLIWAISVAIRTLPRAHQDSKRFRSGTRSE